MTLNLEDLNEEVRKHMLSEVERDEATNNLYVSNRLNEHGRQHYPVLLKEAVQTHDDEWLATELLNRNVFKGAERGTAWGRPNVGRMDRTAHLTLAEGEFNRFYMRGLCVYAIENDISQLEIYRAKAVMEERWQSHIKIGALFSPQVLLDDMRMRVGTPTASGFPPGPNSGISIRIPR